jgi:hypothetical protein
MEAGNDNFIEPIYGYAPSAKSKAARINPTAGIIDHKSPGQRRDELFGITRASSPV